jgi:hypothetical protein
MERPMLAGLTAEKIRKAADELYRPDAFRDAPAQIFLDQFEVADPPTTFLRVSFARFTFRAARKLAELGAALQARHGEHSNLVFVVYLGRIDPEQMAWHSIQMADR